MLLLYFGAHDWVVGKAGGGLTTIAAAAAAVAS